MTKQEFVEAILSKRKALEIEKKESMKDFMRHQKDNDLLDEHLLVEEVERGENYEELSQEGFDEREDYSGRKELESLDPTHHDKGLECYGD